jgi:protein-disulfide isomerase
LVHPLAFVLLALAIAACGREAPPRSAATAGPTLASRQPTFAPAMTQVADAAPEQRALGDPNAPITVIEYGDYQCPFCHSFVQDTKPRIDAEYIKTGKVYFVYRDFPLVDIHPGALLAAHVANCAADQGGFWPMHDRLFEGAAAHDWSSGSGEDFKTFLGYAQDLQLDVGKLQQCLNSNQQAAQIAADYRAGAERGVRSTPTFLINGQPFVGARPYADWQRYLDSLLAR